MAEDKRWSELEASGFRCTQCGNMHRGVFDLAPDAPDLWQGGMKRSANAAFLDGPPGASLCSDDFCVIEGDRYFIRCVLPVPLIGAGDRTFSFGVWCLVFDDDFERYRSTFDDGNQSHLGPFKARIGNRLKPFNAMNARCILRLKDGRNRPDVEVTEADHPLQVAQSAGLDFDALMAIYDANGHGPSASG